jgi:hypothetical protein
VTLDIVCVVVIGAIALWRERRVSHWARVARMLGRDVIVERTRVIAIAAALEHLKAGLRNGDAPFSDQALSTAIRVAKDDTDATLIELGIPLPKRIS